MFDACDIANSLQVLSKGGLIIYPTDTIWGIGCDATNEEAVSKVYALKRRVESKAMLSLLSEWDDLNFWFRSPPTDVINSLRATINKPVTLILDKPIGFAKTLIADDGSIGVRVTDEVFSKELVAKFGKPIVSTSANISGMASPAIFSEICDEIVNGVDYVVKYRQDDTHRALPSSIIKISHNETTILRP